MASRKEVIREELSEALAKNKVITREHIKFILRSIGLKDSSYLDLVYEMRTGKFERVTHIPVTEKIVYRTSFFYKSDAEPTEINLQQAEETWLIDTVRYNKIKSRRSRVSSNIVFIEKRK